MGVPTATFFGSLALINLFRDHADPLSTATRRIHRLPSVYNSTYREAQQNIKEAIEGSIDVSRKFGDEILRTDVIIDTVAVAV